MGSGYLLYGLECNGSSVSHDSQMSDQTYVPCRLLLFDLLDEFMH
jgi:hypothetical protein